MITIGTFLVAFGLEYSIFQTTLPAGGVSGLAIIVNSFLSMIPVGAIILVLNLISVCCGFVTVGGGFGAKTLYASLGCL